MSDNFKHYIGCALPNDPNPARCLSAWRREYVFDDWCDCPCHRAQLAAAEEPRPIGPGGMELDDWQTRRSE